MESQMAMHSGGLAQNQNSNVHHDDGGAPLVGPVTNLGMPFGLLHAQKKKKSKPCEQHQDQKKNKSKPFGQHQDQQKKKKKKKKKSKTFGQHQSEKNTKILLDKKKLIANMFEKIEKSFCGPMEVIPLKPNPVRSNRLSLKMLEVRNDEFIEPELSGFGDVALFPRSPSVESLENLVLTEDAFVRPLPHPLACRRWVIKLKDGFC